MTPIWLPMGYRTEKKNPPTDVLYKEMETMLASTETAHRIINQINPAAFARLGTYGMLHTAQSYSTLAILTTR